MSQAGVMSVANSNPITPNSEITDWDDFLANGGSTLSKLDWQPSGTVSSANGTATNPGIVTLNTSAASSSLTLTDNSVFSSCFVVGGGTLSLNWVMDLVALSTNTNTYTTYIGLSDAPQASTPAAPNSGIYFQYSNGVNSGKWQIVCNNGGVTTVHNTNTTATTGFHNYSIAINASGTSVAFKIDGAAVTNSPITTNIPTAAISPAVISLLSAGSGPSQNIDLFYYTQVLTVAR